MKIIDLNVRDGGGIISVVVDGWIDEDRLRRFVTEGLAAIEEKNERETEVLA